MVKTRSTSTHFHAASSISCISWQYLLLLLSNWKWVYTVQWETLARFLIGNLADWVKIAKFKTCQFKLNVCTHMTLRIQIAKFKCCQYKLRAVSPNLLHTKITHFTVVELIGEGEGGGLSHTKLSPFVCTLHICQELYFCSCSGSSTITLLYYILLWLAWADQRRRPCFISGTRRACPIWPILNVQYWP